MTCTPFLCLIIAASVGHAQPNLQGSKSGPAVQMPGDNGKVGTPYRLGPKGDELVVTLEKAEFASRFFMKDQSGFATTGQRLLVLTYAVQNPGTSERTFSNQSLSFTVVSPDDENFECNGLTANGWAGYHPDRRDRLTVALKPAQKIRAMVAIQIHPKGPINKLIVQRGKGTPVLRYDLKGKVAPLSGAFADNAGQDSVEIGIGKLKSAFDLGQWNITVESVQDVAGNIGGWEPDTGGKFVVVTLLVENASMIANAMHSSIMGWKLTDTDGADMPYAWVMAKADADEAFNGTLDPGSKAHLRVLFRASAKARASKLQIKDQQYSGRTVAIQLAD